MINCVARDQAFIRYAGSFEPAYLINKIMFIRPRMNLITNRKDLLPQAGNLSGSFKALLQSLAEVQ